jgi:hypothetical protein
MPPALFGAPSLQTRATLGSRQSQGFVLQASFDLDAAAMPN